MAELIGLIASVAGLAGIAASVSITLFECGENIANAKSELMSLATELRDLSAVLRFLEATLTQYQALISQVAVSTVEDLISSCEKLCDELKISANLVKSKTSRLEWLFRKPRVLEHRNTLQGFKSSLVLMMQTLTFAKTLEQESSKAKHSGNHDGSASARRNLQLLRSAVLTNKSVLQQLDTTARNAPEKESSLSTVEKKARDELNADIQRSEVKPSEGANTSNDANSWRDMPLAVHVEMENMTWQKVLLNSFKALSAEPPASQTLISAIPQAPTPVKAKWSFNKTESSASSTDEDIKLLLREWTNIPKADIEEHLRFQDFIPQPGIPQWVQDDYDFQGGDPNDPSNWFPKSERHRRSIEVGKILPYSRFAYEPTEEGRTSLYQVLAEEGGAWVWRHDNGYTRDYYVGEKKIVQYFVKSLEKSEGETSLTVDSTIVGKQWISKDVLENLGHTFKSYGEGSWAIEGRLKPSDVTALHEAASSRTEELLRRLSKAPSKPKDNSKPSVILAEALFAFPGKNKGDLPFKKGDTLTILSHTHNNDMWWAAELNNQTGMIPANYVRIIGQNDDPHRTADANPDGSEKMNGTDRDTKNIAKASLFNAWKAKLDGWRKKSRTPEKP